MTAVVDWGHLPPAGDATPALDAPSASTPPRHRWPRPALVALLAATAALYLCNLSASGFGNNFYAAAAQAGSQSWSAWFFGSLDAHNFITVDKPPASLWVLGLSVRLFGMNSWAVLAPQALIGVASVAVLYFAVRRAFADPGHGAAAGLVAGVVLAATPAAALMFRFDNPDALLVLLMTVGAYCLTRAAQGASWRWLMLVAVAIGTAFLTKMLQGCLVLPGFLLTYLLLAPTGWLNRIVHLLGAAVALVVAAGWWVLTVQLWPAGARPYIGGSTDNTVLDLAFGYNGMSRIVGAGGEADHHGGPPAMAPPGDWEPPRGSAFGALGGIHRLFTAEMANEISWLLPVALLAIAFGVYLAVRGQLSRDEKGALVTWGGWLVVTALVFGYMSGVVHPYYTVALAPAVAALIGLAGVWAWRRRAGWDGRIAPAAMIVLACGWSAILLHRNGFGPAWTHRTIAVAAAVAATGVIVYRRRTVATAAATIGLLAGLGGPAAFSVATAATPHRGSIPTAVNTLHLPVRGGGWMGDDANTELAGVLAATRTPWSAATSGSQSASALEIASGTSVMAVGGWSNDPVPTLQQFIDDVHAGKISYYVEAGRGQANTPGRGQVTRGPNHGAHSREIADWVARHYPATTIGATTVYRLT
jgi:4-amino-4-deoxy-L-arabinose transferase-like glycosyltransferase